MEFMRNTRSEDGERELYSHNLILNALKSKVYVTLKEINKTLPSRSTSGSRASHHSSISTVVMQQRAKAEAAQTLLKLAREEAVLKKAQTEMQLKQATLEANIELLKKECEAETAAAELGVMEEEILNASVSLGIRLQEPHETIC